MMVKDNPESYPDLDGHDCCDVWNVINFLLAGANAYFSDNAGGYGRQQQTTTSGKLGQVAGDASAFMEGNEKVGTAAAVDTASLSADATGVGAALGVPAMVAANVLGTQGVVESTTAGVNLVKDVINAPAQSKGSGPKAADAPGVSSSGRATDAHGNKLGGSGKPQVHETESNTREGARNKSLNGGSTAVNHNNPTTGKPHYHSGDAQGEKKPTSTHHNYPE